ncbi:MAG: hypothetical protein JXB47_13030 [Anaerolineae bacterium]|nr:hypothetical protein [Anaerolineae bacterium]
MKLDRDTLNELIELLAPHMGSENERRALLSYALVGSPVLASIDYGGSTQPFIINLINRLAAYGNIAPGRSALWALLKTLKAYVGEDKQARIDALREAVNPDSDEAQPAWPESDEEESKYKQERALAIKRMMLTRQMSITEYESALADLGNNEEINRRLDTERSFLAQLEQELQSL